MTDFRVDKEKRKSLHQVKQILMMVKANKHEIKRSAVQLAVLNDCAVSKKYVDTMIDLVLDQETQWQEEEGVIWYMLSE